MRQALTMLLTFPFLVFFMFQPFLSEVVHMRGLVLEQTVHKYTKLAAREGYVSPSLITSLRNELAALHYQAALLDVAGTTSGRLARGETVTLEVSYPTGSLFIFSDWFGADSGPARYRFTASEMSEYIP